MRDVARGVTQYFVRLGSGRLREVKRGPQGPTGEVLRQKNGGATSTKGQKRSPRGLRTWSPTVLLATPERA